jgi:plasmid replication initiation protein
MAKKRIEPDGQGDLFRCEIAQWPLKDDIGSMEAPLFSLAKQKDLDVREYRRGEYVFKVIPSVIGAATVFDKDLLLYIGSQIVEARNRGREVSKTVVIDSSDFLKHTARSDSRESFERIHDMLMRLSGTRIETNFATGGVRQVEGFGIIENYKVREEVKRSGGVKNDRAGKPKEQEIRRIFRFEVTLSEWFFNGLLNYEVLTLEKAYFALTSSINRRLYEIARKHCGGQALWKINIDLLAEKTGTTRERFKFRSDLRQTIKADLLPEYHMALDADKTPDDVVFYTRNNAALVAALNKNKQFAWFQTLERHKGKETTAHDA